ncbi:RagB/SusD family nutrient uptake outer membrane protein [Capnocytophaga canimorsus]|uniref:RagB/SusD family nutrient uptake outer membrane protein n=2 Tax=Capnocytophaga canimorsus TaxID=28188 RepID=UPI00385D5109
MKMFNKIKLYTIALAMSGALASCSDYLDVVPPEQAGLPDATRDYESTLRFAYSCYAGIDNPFNYSVLEAASDEWVLPPKWGETMHTVVYGLSSPVKDLGKWGHYYKYVGQCNLFLRELPKAKGVTDEEKKEFRAEARFARAYYHMRTLFIYGPCPIIEEYVFSNENMPGRYHFDYVVDWIAKEFDEAANDLPATRSGQTWGRATSVMAKALKARMLVYAASPLWNGSFPFPEWKNTSFETPGYGKNLVSLSYDGAKWVRAKDACQEALDLAKTAGHRLYSDEELHSRQGVDLPYVPGVDPNTNEGRNFLKKVMLMRYLVTTRVNEGNQEIIWGLANQGNMIIGSLPNGVMRNSEDNLIGGYSGVSPILNTSIEYFYTKNGKRPAHDPDFADKSEWFKSANMSGAGRNAIIKLNVNREPRFYAWFAFDGGEYGSKVKDGRPLQIEARDPNKQGFNLELYPRNNNATGYFNQKYVNPLLKYHRGSRNEGDYTNAESKPRPLIRLAELYLNLAECEAALDNQSGVFANLNEIRRRAGVPELTAADLSAQNLMEWVRNERFIELWGEGHRYYDIRRWMIAPQTMAEGKRLGLSADVKKSPTFEEFNTVIPIRQDFRWVDRMYLQPVGRDESYKIPNLVQTPGY